MQLGRRGRHISTTPLKTVSALRVRLALLLSLVATGTSLLAQDNTRNYVLTRTHKATGQSPDAQYSVDQVHMALTYFDGLGRPQQAIGIQASRDKKDLVSPTEYDALGRVSKTWLPAPTGTQNAAFQGDAPGVVRGYYLDGNRFEEPSDRPYTETRYESSPLNRVSETVAPAAGASVRRTYGVNGDNEVKRYDAGSGLTDITNSGNYPARTLTLTTTKDEQDNELSEFTDRDGRVVLRRAGKNGQYATTYYVYDDLGQLRAVLQPQYQSNTDLNKYAFLYRYDGQGRVVEKRVPGANTVTMEYNDRDLLVASTDGRGQKFYYHYDELNRQIEMGLCNGCNPADRYNGGGKQSLVRTQYDRYDNLPGFDGGDGDLVGGYYTNGSGQVLGQVTGQWVRLLQADGNLGNELQSVNFYDSKYRLVQARRQLTLGSNGWERITYQRDFLGKVTKERTTQSWSGQSQSWEKTYTYDTADRLTSTTARVSGGGLPERTITLSALSYNEVGLLTGRKLHATDAFGSGAKASLGYKYNVRGWLRTVSNSPQSFGLSLNYQQNGNVSYLGWQHPGSGGNYNFEYDELNRLKKGRNSGGGGLGEELTYDYNGNIQTLKRFNGGGGMIDDLGYSYDGNRLTKVTDGTGNGEGFNNGGSGNGDDYTYDGAGNMTTDANRGANLAYNVLNLPRQISLNGKTLNYTYDGGGSKRNLSVVGSGVVTTYEGAFEYDGGVTLKRIATDEGQLISSGGNWQWQYYLRDHLGNVRVVLDENGNALQQTEYQPFGLAMPVQPGGSVAQSAGVNKYLYNGKEWQPETGYLDYGWRMLDPAIARWFTVDPSGEAGGQERFTTYGYVFDNPALLTDPDGREAGGCCDGIVSYVNGIGSALRDDLLSPSGNSLFSSNPSNPDAFNSGRTLGHGFSAVVGLAEVVGGAVTAAAGGAVELASFGAATPVAVPATLAGAAAVVHGANTLKNAASNLSNDKGRVNASSQNGDSGSSNQKPSLKEQASNLRNSNEGKNSVTIKDSKGQTRYDLAGKEHNGVPTPHKQRYNNNIVNGEVRNISRASKNATPMSQEDIRTVRKYLEKKKTD